MPSMMLTLSKGHVSFASSGNLMKWVWDESLWNWWARSHPVATTAFPHPAPWFPPLLLGLRLLCKLILVFKVIHCWGALELVLGHLTASFPSHPPAGLPLTPTCRQHKEIDVIVDVNWHLWWRTLLWWSGHWISVSFLALSLWMTHRYLNFNGFRTGPESYPPNLGSSSEPPEREQPHHPPLLVWAGNLDMDDTLTCSLP